MKQPMYVVGLILGGVGCLFILIGMATPSWLISGSNSVGLFMVCGSRGCASYDAEGANAAAKAFEVIAFLCALAAAIDGIVYYFKYVNKDIPNRLLPLVSAIFFLISAGLAILGVIIFAAKAKDDIERALSWNLNLGYSFALPIVGGVFCGVAGGLTLAHRQGQAA